MFIITDRAVFAPDEDHSNEFRNEYYTEVDLTTLVISEDLTKIGRASCRERV